MTKDKMIEGVMRHSGISKANVERFYDGLVSLARKELRTKGEFVLPGLGALKVRARKARMARNPRTGEPVRVPAKKVVRLIPYSGLKDLFTKKEEEPAEEKEGLL
ncbi:MAG: HU family DNA-binding protein [bacterium]